MDWYRPPPRPTTDTQLDERIEWDWFHFWHHEGRQAHQGVSMIGPGTHSRGIREVAERIYKSPVPAARKLARAAAAQGKQDQGAAVEALIEEILAQPEHAWQLPEPNATRAKLENAGSVR